MSTDANAASDFLNKLATDDSFRARVESDPAAVYAEHGLKLDPKELAEMAGGAKLPSKEEITANMATYKKRHEEVHAMMMFIAIGSK